MVVHIFLKVRNLLIRAQPTSTNTMSFNRNKVRSQSCHRFPKFAMRQKRGRLKVLKKRESKPRKIPKWMMRSFKNHQMIIRISMLIESPPSFYFFLNFKIFPIISYYHFQGKSNFQKRSPVLNLAKKMGSPKNLFVFWIKNIEINLGKKSDSEKNVCKCMHNK